MRFLKSRQKALGLVFVFCCGALILAACGKSGKDEAAAASEPASETAAVQTPAPPAADPYAGWIEYGSDPYGFSVMTPKPFDLSRDTSETEAGDIGLVTFLAELETASYGVVCSEFTQEFIDKADPEIMLHSGSSGFLEKLSGTLTSERQITLDGNPGLEIVMTGMSQGLDLFGKARFYLAGTRLYQVIVIAAKGTEDLVAIDHFLDSFKLKQ